MHAMIPKEGAGGRDTPQSADDWREVARLFSPDRYIAALLAPSALKPDLINLAAFDGELVRIVTTLSEPMMSRIRLQWWRDALEAGDEGMASGHPLADALGGWLRSGRLDKAQVLGVVDAAERSLDDVLSGVGVSEEGAIARETGLFVLAARLLDPAAAPSREDFAKMAQAYAIAGQAWMSAMRDGAVVTSSMPGAADRPTAAAEARLPELERLYCALSRPERLAAAPVAMVRPYLSLVHDGSDAPRARRLAMLPLTRVWRLWRAVRLGRIS